MYQKDYLRDYINSSELRQFSYNIKVRMSKELAIEYDKGLYNDFLLNIKKCFKLISDLGIQYPGNAHPVLYLYIVPQDNYSKLLNIPKEFDRGKGGGKPVCCYDLDGFNSAYGLSENLLKKSIETISSFVNNIHELAHIINSQFFRKNRMIQEGFAEMVPLYLLGLEEEFLEHRNMIIELKDEQILSAKELIESERDNTYGTEELVPNRSCSFRKSYVSSYLFITGCIKKIEEKMNCSKIEAVQHFLEFVKQSNFSHEFLIHDLAHFIGVSIDELLFGKEMQLEVIDSIKTKRDHLI